MNDETKFSFHKNSVPDAECPPMIQKSANSIIEKTCMDALGFIPKGELKGDLDLQGTINCLELALAILAEDKAYTLAIIKDVIESLKRQERVQSLFSHTGIL